MSDIPDPTFLDHVVDEDQIYFFPLPVNAGVSIDGDCTEDELSEPEFGHANFNGGVFDNEELSDNDSSIESLSLPDCDDDIAVDEFREFLDHLQAMTMELARLEIQKLEESLRKHNKALETRNIRMTFRKICCGLQTSLSDLDTWILKKLDILRMGAADRIAVRPLFLRAGYSIDSADPPVGRNGLPRAISFPDNLSAREDIEAISQLCLEYPEGNDELWEFDDCMI